MLIVDIFAKFVEISTLKNSNCLIKIADRTCFIQFELCH